MPYSLARRAGSRNPLASRRDSGWHIANSDDSGIESSRSTTFVHTRPCARFTFTHGLASDEANACSRICGIGFATRCGLLIGTFAGIDGASNESIRRSADDV